MTMSGLIDCRPAAIAKEIAPADQKFALILFNLDSQKADTSSLLAMIDSLFDKTDIKVWLDEHQLVMFSSYGTPDLDLFSAVKKIEAEVVCNAGIVFYPDDGESFSVLTTKAYEVSCRQTHSFSKRAIQKGLKENEFFLVFQPQVDSRTGDFIGVEALIRWHPDHATRTVMPMEFLPVAEAEGLMDQICKWTLFAACRQSLSWQAQQCAIRVAVNISTSYLLNPEFLSDLNQVIEETGVNPELLEIEITENRGIGRINLDRIVCVIEAVRKMGIRVSLDDFGMEFNSLEILRVLPLDRIKIDKVFVQNLATSKVKVIVQATIAIARALNIECVAEGVESVDQVAVLEKMGCFEMQGYYFGKPEARLPAWRRVPIQ